MDRKYTFSSYMITSAFKRNDKIGLSIGLNSDLCDTFRLSLIHILGDYDHFQEVYAVQKAQLEAAYKRQQQEISELQDFVARNKARVSTRNMAMSRPKKLDKMEKIELAAERPKPEFHFQEARAAGKILFETKDLVIGYDEPLSRPLNPVSYTPLSL